MTTIPLAQIVLDNPLRKLFDYQIPNDLHTQLTPGCRVLVPFGRRMLTGVFIGFTDNAQVPEHKLKQIKTVIDQAPLFNHEALQLIMWAAHYYHTALGCAVFTALPPALRKADTHGTLHESYISPLQADAEKLQRAPKQKAIFTWLLEQQPHAVTQSELQQTFPKSRSAIQCLIEKGYIKNETRALPPQSQHPIDSHSLNLTPAQNSISQALLSRLNNFNPCLLEGVTGSGKTEIYFSLIEKVLQTAASQVLILVPEIGLTPQLQLRLQKHFSTEIGLLHSNITETTRYKTWLKISRGDIRVVLGTRLAVFTPMPQLKMIIVDEEHDPSFKQQEGFLYHARDVAIYRAKQNNIPIILGSATPSFESLHNVSTQKYHHLQLTERVFSDQLPSIHVSDMRAQSAGQILSRPLVDAMQRHLSQDKQVILFLNRRGYAPALYCHDCGWVAKCPRCDSNMTYHSTHNKLICHHCDYHMPKSSICGECQSSNVALLGHGTQRVEEMLEQAFPNYAHIRLDRDSTRHKGSMETILDDIHQHKYQIIIGTQILSKGHDFPDVTLVGVLDIDYGIYSHDFRAMERSAQLLMQVAGRAGRRNVRGEVFVQTHNPDHPLLTTLIQKDYTSFAQQALSSRKEYQLPPYVYHIILRARAGHPEAVQAFLIQAKNSAHTIFPKEIKIQGPIIPAMEKKAGQYRAFLLLTRTQRGQHTSLINAWIEHLSQQKNANRVYWSIDVDPIEFT